MLVVVGVQVSNDVECPEGLTQRSISAGKYALFVAKDIQELQSTWKTIWESDLKRTFKADFELYKNDGSAIEIYIGIQ